MANYCCTIRTNYFHVKDKEKFLKLMSKVYGCEDSVELWEEKDNNGESIFWLGVYGCIAGVCNAQSDDAIIILEAGNEKMRYVVGTATIITSNGCEYLDITQLATKKAAELLCNSAWKTKCEY